MYSFKSFLATYQTPLILVAFNFPCLALKLKYSWEYFVSFANSFNGINSFSFVVGINAFRYKFNDLSTDLPIKLKKSLRLPECAFSRLSKYFFLSFLIITAGG